MNIKPSLRVIKSGVFTLLQDPGRFNQAQQGLSQGGFSDELAASWANYLLGNRPHCSLLEICFGQAEFEATIDMHLALTGAPMNAKIKLLSGQLQAQNNNCSFILKQGQRLILSYANSGVRAYLAVQGGFSVNPILSSVSCVKRNAIGGLDGQGNQLKDNDILPLYKQIEFNQHTSRQMRKIPKQFIPNYDLPITLSVIESYQCDSFSADEKQRFYSSEYRVDKQNDRMGMRLQGELIRSRLNSLVSEGIALGSIQIPADGQPIILLQDRQTLGGYPKIGCVARCDLSLLGQQSAGKHIYFKRGELQVEQHRYITRLTFFNQLSNLRE